MLKRNDPNNLIYRKMPVQTGPKTLNADKRSVDVIAATEGRVQVYDWEHGLIDEILLAKGAVLPYTKQVPLLDSHQRYDTSSVIGSAQGLNINNNQIEATAYFAEKSEDQWALVRDGHLTDFSIGYKVDPEQTIYVEAGKTKKISGVEYPGPVLIRKKWYLKELSLVPIGADPAAKARHDNNKKESYIMDEKVRKFLESRGLAADATEEQAWVFMQSLERKEKEEKKIETPAIDIDKIRSEAAGEERSRIQAIDGVYEKFRDSGVDREFCNDFIRSGVNMNVVNSKVLTRIQEFSAKDNVKTQTPATIQADEKDKFREAAVDSVLIRSGISIEKPVAGADDLTGFSLVDLARKSLILSGKRDNGNPMDMLQRAATTSFFPTILGTIANKSLYNGFNNANETWNQWCATGSVSDFKTYTSARVSAFDDLDLTPEGVPMKYAQPSDAKEQYSISSYTKAFAITFQAMKNDDLNALSDVPMKMGQSAARKVGDIVYAVFTANPTMGDGTALFASGHSNLAGTPAVLSESTLGLAIKAMKLQKDISSKQRLNVQPKFHIAPVALESAHEIFYNTTNYTSDEKASTRSNIYAGKFQRVYEPRLDDSSATAWYLAADKGKTVKVFFLDGQMSPTLTRQQGNLVLGEEFFLSFHFGAKAMDWVGLYKNAGA